MKRFLSLLAVLTLLASLAVPAWGTEDTFVPSIGYKDGPDVEKAEIEDDDVTPCLVVTSILEAKNKETDIFQEDRDMLLHVIREMNEFFQKKAHELGEVYKLDEADGEQG